METNISPSGCSGVERAVDLCAAPGSWSQVLASRLYPGGVNETCKVSQNATCYKGGNH